MNDLPDRFHVRSVITGKLLPAPVPKFYGEPDVWTRGQAEFHQSEQKHRELFTYEPVPPASAAPATPPWVIAPQPGDVSGFAAALGGDFCGAPPTSEEKIQAPAGPAKVIPPTTSTIPAPSAAEPLRDVASGGSTFEDWARRGFGDDLIPIAPGNLPAAVWRGSPDSAGKCPARRDGDGAWLPLARWERLRPNAAALRAWGNWGANIGLRTRNFPTFDCDADDAAIARVVEEVISGSLGLFGGTVAVRRRVGSPRFAIPARLEGPPLGKAVLAFTLPDGRRQKVELLGDGQQFVVAGVHKSGARLEWSERPAAADLPRLGGALADMIFREIEQALARLGCTDIARGGAARDRGDEAALAATPDRPALAGAELEAAAARARSALEHLDPAEFEYRDWIRVGQALRHDLGERGFEIWNAWSKRDASRLRAEDGQHDGGPRYQGAASLRAHWRTFRCKGAGADGRHARCARLGTIFRLAQDAGWQMSDDGPPADVEFAATGGDDDEYADLLGGERLWATNADALLRPAPALPSPSADGPRYQIVHKGKQVTVAKTPENVALYFAQDARFTGTGLLRLNVRRGVELNGVLLMDVGYTALGAEVTRAHAWDTVPSAEHLYAGVQLAAAQRQYDPIREYLDRLRWDGTPRLDDWLVRAGAEDTPATRLVGRRWMIGAAGRGLHEPQPGTPPEFAPSVDRGTKMDYCLVLEGPQGRKKSAVFEALCPEPYFFDSSFSFDAGRVKDLYQALGENFLVEMAELDALSKSDVQAAKAVITSRTDKYRAPYARVPEAHPRRAALAGSANGREWQRDLTGGRRFWPAWCPGELDARWVREHRDQLWAEAVHAYRAGEVYWEDDELRTLIAPEQEERVNLPGWAHLVLPLLEANKARGVFTMEELVQRERGLATLSTNQVADVLRYFGCTGPYRVKESGKVERVWEQGDLALPEVRRRVHAGALRSSGFAGAPTFLEPPRGLPGAAE